MRTLILNQSNIVPNTFNSRLEYTFPAGNVHIQKGQKLALASLEMYYSTFNITSVNNNNKFNYVWVDGTLVQVTIPDGYYTIATLNEFLQFTMIQNLHYLVDNDTQNFVYFLSLGTNASTYKIELTTFLMNATLFVIGTGAGEYTFPAGATWQVPNNNIVPMFQLLPNNFRNVIGFSNAGYYPTGASGNYAQAVITGTPPNQVQTGAGTPYTGNIVFSSNSVPQVSPLSSFLLKCNLINNNYAVPNDLLYSFSPQADFGQQFTIAPNQLIFINIQEGQYNKFQVEFADQNNQPVAIVDPNFVILLIISDEGDIGVS
jgi:hypothetical protein